MHSKLVAKGLLARSCRVFTLRVEGSEGLLIGSFRVYTFGVGSGEVRWSLNLVPYLLSRVPNLFCNMVPNPCWLLGGFPCA